MTNGISPKAALAAIFPALATLTLCLVNGAFTGFDQAELQAAVVGVVASGLAFAGAYFGHPGDVVHPTADVASDDLLAADAAAKIAAVQEP